MYLRKTLYFLLFVLVSTFETTGQQYGFKNFSLEEGLPQTEVYAILQDSRANIWVGTNGGGLSRFNGRQFQTYTTHEGLKSNQVWAIFEDSGGNLWIGTSNTVSKYNGISFRNFSENPVPFLRTYQFFHEDMNGDIWVVSSDEQSGVRLLKIENDHLIDMTGKFPELFIDNNLVLGFLSSADRTLYISSRDGLYELKNNQISFSPLNKYNELSGSIIIPVYQDADGTFWFFAIRSRNERTIYTYRNEQLQVFQTPATIWWNSVSSFYKDRNNRLWFGNVGEGIAMISGATGKITYFRQSNGLSSDFVLGFMEDHEGNIWMRTQGGGIIKYSKNNFIAYNFDNIINDNVVRVIFQDSDGNYWFGFSGTGIVKYDGTHFTSFPKEQFPGLINVRDVTQLDHKNYLILTLNGLFIFNGRDVIPANQQYGFDDIYQYSDVLQDNDNLWLATQGNGVFKLNNGNIEQLNISNGRLLSNQVHSLFKDTKGRIWICTTNGPTVYDKGETHTYTTDDGLNNSIFIQITQDFSGRYWMATFTGGINVLDGEKIRYITTEHGLTSNIIYSILTDRSGNIWAGTQNGVDRISIDNAGNISGIQHYGVNDGFTGIENNGAANLVDREGNLWFGTVNGAMKFDPGNTEVNTIPPVTQITNVKLFYRNIDWRNNNYSRFNTAVSPWFPLPENLIFPHDSNHFSFEFEALSYMAPEKVRYQWKLEGLDKVWSPVTNKTEAVYPKIPPGNYIFKVMAMNNDGIWCEEPAQFSFKILVPWWNSIWFYVTGGILFFAGIVLIFRLRIRIIEVKRKELEQLVREKTMEVVNKNQLLEQQKEEILIQSENLQKAYHNLEYLSEIGRIITSQLSIESIVDAVYKSINNLMDATVFGIGIINKKNHSIDFPGVKEKGETLDFLSFSLDDKLRLSVYCVNNKKEIFINDFEKEYHKYLPEITPPGESGNSSSIIYLPLIRDNKAMGVITVQSFEKNAYNDYHMSILRNLAVYTKIALDNASAYRKIQEQTEHVKRANEDINKQKLEIEKANKELLELNNEKNHLIEILAHDLRNPLTSSLSIATNLEINSDYLNEDDKDNVSFLVSSLRRMHSMISRILDIRMIEQKKIYLNCEKMDFGKVLQEVINNFKNAAKNKNISIHRGINHLYGIADRNYLIQVFENLLSNAIKFSPPNKNVWVKLEEQNGEIRINFKDEGPGFTEEDMKKLFRQFQSLSAQPTAGEKSTGLGLSIVKKYVDIMGGRVWCESQYGQGANFIVTFQKIK